MTSKIKSNVFLILKMAGNKNTHYTKLNRYDKVDYYLLTYLIKYYNNNNH